MLDMLFQEDNKDLGVLINSKNVLQNLSYKLANDRNSIYFFENLIYNIQNYFTLDRMVQYHFKNDFDAMFITLKKFYIALQNEVGTTKMSADIIKCCNVFPDHIGERIIILISHLPIMELFNEQVKFKEMLDLRVDLNSTFMGQTIIDHQEDVLFSEGLFSKKFPDDSDFIDYKLRNRFLDKLEKEFNDSRKDELETAIMMISSLFKETNKNTVKSLKIKLGSTYWDEDISVSNKNFETFKNVFLALNESFSEEKL